jgi:protein SCO1/2
MRPLALICALLLAGCASKPPATLHGMQLSPPQPAANFTLIDQNGALFSLSQARGQAVALYFGFTQCTDVCPQTLALLGKARTRARLTSAQARIVMVTVDPRRDSPAALRTFFRKVGVQATGLTGTATKLAPVYRAYGIGIEPQKHDIAHTDAIFIIDPHGRIRETLPPETPLKDVAADLRAVVD